MTDLTVSRQAILQALAECDRLGRDDFLGQYGFGRAREWFLEHNGRRYDSKAVVGVARQFDHPTLGPLKPHEFSGGEATVVKVLENLGFTVVHLKNR